MKRRWGSIKGRVDAGQWSRETANKRLTMLRSIYNHALDDEPAGLAANPTARIKKRRIDLTTLPTEHFASIEERERVIEAAKPNPRLYAAVLLAAFYGLRRASVCDLRVRDLDFPGGDHRVGNQDGSATRAAITPACACSARRASKRPTPE